MQGCNLSFPVGCFVWGFSSTRHFKSADVAMGDCPLSVDNTVPFNRRIRLDVLAEFGNYFD